MIIVTMKNDKMAVVVSVAADKAPGKQIQLIMGIKKHFRLAMAFWLLTLPGFLGNANAAPPDNGWAEIWGDEFDGTATTTNQYGVDTTKWGTTLPWTNTAGGGSTVRWYQTGDLAWIADECNVVSNGYLWSMMATSTPTTFTGHNTFYYKEGWLQNSGKMNYTWGYAEIRAQWPSGTAMWPTWWELGANGDWPPEMDNAELYPSGQNTMHMGMYYNKAGTGTWTSGSAQSRPYITTGMNVYGFEWDPGYTSWFTNGVSVTSFASQYVPSQPVYTILSGGVVTNSQNGSFNNQSFPVYVVVDYVRLFKRSEYVYNGDFGITNNQSGSYVADWTFTGSATNKSGAGVGGKNALFLSTASLSVSKAQQTVYGLVPHTTYLLSGNLQSSNGSPVYLGVSGYGNGFATTEQSTNITGSYAPLTVAFTTGNTNTTANVYGQLKSSGSGGYLDELTVQRAAAVADPGFETGIPSTYWNDGSRGTYSAVLSNARSGHRSLSLGAANSAVQQLILGLQTNTTYQLSCWAKANGNTVYLGATNFGGTAVSAPITTTSSYGKTNVTFTTGSTNTTALIYAYNSAYNGTAIYLDDFFLSEPLAANWQRVDVGSVVLAGDSGQRGSQFVLRGSGADVWGTADACHFVYQTLTGNGRITARVLKVDPTDSNAKAGIMLRDGTNASSAHVALDWLSSGYVEFLMRTNSGQATGSQSTSSTVPIAPFVRLERLGNTFTASWSRDGTNNWNVVATGSATLSQTLNAGLFVNSHNTAQINEGLFENVSIVTNVGGLSVGTTTFSPPSPVNAGAPVTASATIAGGTPGYTYQWQSSPDNSQWSTAGGASTSVTYSPDTSSAGTNYYRLLVTDSFSNVVTNTAAALVVNAVSAPIITNVSLSGTTLTISGTNGTAGGQYVLLGSTNMSLPLNQWTPLLTNTFDSSGNINLSTNIVNLGLPLEFYILSQ
jgi:beta-glucanase (GH16 family)